MTDLIPTTAPTPQANPGIAVLLSMLWPGLGHLYARKAWGVVLMILTPVAWFFVLAGIPLVPFLYLFAMISAYRQANR